MKKYEIRSFDIPELKGISKQNIEEHLKLYAGYVKNTNDLAEKIEELSSSLSKNSSLLTELQRRFSFEFDGMRNHEYFFTVFDGGSKEIPDGDLKNLMEGQWGSFEKWLEIFKTISKTRGIGWAILYYDPLSNQLVNAWVDEHHLGQLNGLKPVLCLDMWEHAFVSDYLPSGKGQYIDDFFENVNWEKVNESFINSK